jgi:tetratricopeptide (TPR) repeat protein
MTAEIDALWDYADPAVSEARFRAVLESASGPERLEFVTQIARAQGLQGRFEEGHATIDQIADEVSGRQRVRYLLERGRLFNSAGEPEQAVSLFREAVAEAEGCGEVALEIDARHMLGIAAPVEEREAWTRSAIDRAERATDPAARRWLGSLLNNLGWSLHDSGQFDEALACFERVLAWQQENGSERAIRIARWSVGRALRSCGHVERALAVQESLAQSMATGEPDGYVFEEIGECLLALGRDAEARPWFARAWSALSTDEWLVRTEPDRLDRLRELSAGKG